MGQPYYDHHQNKLLFGHNSRETTLDTFFFGLQQTLDTSKHCATSLFPCGKSSLAWGCKSIDPSVFFVAMSLSLSLSLSLSHSIH
jgi:hypothetical protein